MRIKKSRGRKILLLGLPQPIKLFRSFFGKISSIPSLITRLAPILLAGLIIYGLISGLARISFPKNLSIPTPVGKVDVELDKARLDEIVNGWFTFLAPGKDKSGKKATFDFSTLIYDYAWKLGESNKVESYAGKSLDAEPFLIESLRSSKISLKIQSASDLIAVGAASCEGTQSSEEQRAEQRARVIRGAIDKSNIKVPGQIYILLLGQYKASNCSAQNPQDTRSQRGFTVIHVKQKDDGVNLEEALKDAVTRASRDKAFQEELRKSLRNPSISPLGSLNADKYSLFKLQIN